MVIEHDGIRRESEVARGGERKTIFFEEKYGEDITRFRSISDVDSFIEMKRGRKLEVKQIKSNLVSNSGNLFNSIKYDVERKFRRMIGV